MKKQRVKYILTFLITSVMLFSTACTGTQGQSTDTENTNSIEDTAEVGTEPDTEMNEIPVVNSSKDLLTFTPSKADELVLSEKGNCAPILIENYNETALDALGRELVSSDQVGLPQENKWVGLFYSLWTCSESGSVKTNIDVTKAIACDPEHPYLGSYGTFCWWSEPETGYHMADDVWQIRRDMRYFAMAGVDFLYIDFTNTFLYHNGFKTLLDTMLAMREEGQMTPYIVPWITADINPNTCKGCLGDIYETFYKQEKYKDLWFYWEGKPLVMLKQDKQNGFAVLQNQEYMNFFTFRLSWVGAQWLDMPKGYNSWGDNVNSGGYGYGWHDDPQQAEAMGIGTTEGFAYPGDGRSGQYSNNEFLDRFIETGTMGEGIVFQRAFQKVMTRNPECQVLLITRWNEWTAQNFRSADKVYDQNSSTFGFVDQFNAEFSRDIEPMKGGFTDNYFYQMCNIIRTFKGVLPAEGNTGAQTMDVEGDFTKWQNIYPVFTDYENDTKWRNSTDPTGTIRYVNSTGRNDIVESRLTADKGMVYVYARTAKDMTSYKRNPNWMLLFIDADQDKSTGWEGYDFVVNYEVLSDTMTTLCAYIDDIWQEIGTVQYQRQGTELMIAIPRSLLGLVGESVAVNFHWMDHVTDIYDLESWFTTGDSAPERRNNYSVALNVVYDASAETVLVGRTEEKIAYMPATELTKKEEGRLQSGLHMSVYNLPVNYGKFPNIYHIENNKMVTMSVGSISADIGFRTSNFALSYDGYVKIPQNGEYRFRIACDDGAMLYIDGRLVAEVSYDAERESGEVIIGTGSIRLATGYHTFKLEYAETGNGQALLAVDGDWDFYVISESNSDQSDDIDYSKVEEIELDLVETISGKPTLFTKRIEVRNMGTVLGLGSMDLSLYAQVEISYCSDGKAMLGDVGSFFALTTNKTSINSALGNTNIIVQGNMENAQGDWGADIRTVTLDLSEIAYEGDTYLAVYMADHNGVNITGIKFTVAEEPTPKPQEPANGKTITFVDEDGSVLQEKKYAEGDIPVYQGEVPTKPADDQFTYTFYGWDKEVIAVTAEVTYTAIYSAKINVRNTELTNCSLHATVDAIEFRKYNPIVGLGEIDLSKYTRVEIHYGNGTGGAALGDTNDYFALKSTATAITDTEPTDLLGTKGQMTASDVQWGAGKRCATIDLTGVDHSGEVYFAFRYECAINVYDIVFIPA